MYSRNIDPWIRNRVLHHLDAEHRAEQKSCEQEEYERGDREFVSLKHFADGRETVEEVAERLDELSIQLQSMVADGFTLEYPVESGHLSLVRKRS